LPLRVKLGTHMACAELADIVFYPLYAHEYKTT